MTTKKTKVIKCDPKDLEQLKNYTSGLQNLQIEIAQLELTKADKVAVYFRGASDFKTFREGLNIKYGEVNIDINTGIITSIEKEKDDGPNKKD